MFFKAMILSQIDIEWWHLALLALGLVLVKGFEWFKEWLKDRRERKQDQDQTTFLCRIADSNQSMAESIATLNERLLGERELHKQMHAENLERIRGACRYKQP